jgi:hypothetical protein
MWKSRDVMDATVVVFLAACVVVVVVQPQMMMIIPRVQVGTVSQSVNFQSH